jgi:hypothetical protein
MRDLWGGLRIRLRSHAACPEAGRAFGQSRRLQELRLQENLHTRLFQIPPLSRERWGSPLPQSCPKSVPNEHKSQKPAQAELGRGTLWG